MIGFWKSRETGLVVEVITETDHAVWYVMAAWRGCSECARDVFLAAMEPLPLNSQP